MTEELKKLESLLNWRELSRLVTGNQFNLRTYIKIPEKHVEKIDNLIFIELPKWWKAYKKENYKK